MQIHLNNNDNNNNNNNNNKNWINSAIHNCIPIIKSITLKITDKRFSFSISHDLARWGCGAGGALLTMACTGTFFRFQVYERVGISLVEFYEMLEISVV